MKTNGLVIISTVVAALLLAGFFAYDLFRKRATRKPEANDTAAFQEAIALYRTGKSDSVNANKLRIGPEELALLEDLDEVTYLRLGGSTVRDSDMELIAGLPGLKTLELTGTRITDEGFARLRNHPTLENLWIGRTRISDKGLDSLKTIPHLVDLNLWSDNITSAGCRSLGAMKTLQKIDLNDTMVGDSGIASLYPLKDLKEIRVGGTPITRQGRDALRRQWPGIRLNDEFADEATTAAVVVETEGGATRPAETPSTQVVP